jgi:hypothetical protein
VERRQASAPDSGRRGASRSFRGAPRTPYACGWYRPRLPAFRFPFFAGSEPQRVAPQQLLVARSGLFARQSRHCKRGKANKIRCLTSLARQVRPRERDRFSSPSPAGGGSRPKAARWGARRPGELRAWCTYPHPLRCARDLPPAGGGEEGVYPLAYLPRLKKRSFWSSLAVSRLDLITATLASAALTAGRSSIALNQRARFGWSSHLTPWTS